MVPYLSNRHTTAIEAAVRVRVSFGPDALVDTMGQGWGPSYAFKSNEPATVRLKPCLARRAEVLPHLGEPILASPQAAIWSMRSDSPPTRPSPVTSIILPSTNVEPWLRSGDSLIASGREGNTEPRT